MNANRTLLGAVIGLAVLSASLVAYILRPLPASELLETSVLENSISSALKNDEVTVFVHDSEGNLKSEQKTHNIITSAGAIWFCIEQNRCESQITNPNMVSVNNPTWWVQFISGTPNTDNPTAADCTSPSGGGNLTGQVSSNRCVTNFGSDASGAQYQAGGFIVSVSDFADGTGQLQASTGNYDTTNRFIQTTAASVCSIVDDGNDASSGTCQFTETTAVLTNMSGSPITVNGLALASGAAGNVAAGPLIIAESIISTVTLAPGDTISVAWTVVT